MRGRPVLALLTIAVCFVAVLPQAAHAIGSFTLAGTPSTSSPVGVAGGDVNGDGLTDLVTVSTAASQGAVLLGLGNGSFNPPVSVGSGANPSDVTLADMNGDTKLDAVFANGTNAGVFGVSVAIGNGNGTFQAAVFTSAGSSLNGSSRAAVGDLNADGRPDVVVANQGTTAARILLGSGGGALSLGIFVTASGTPADVAIGDLNLDGRLDIAIPSGSGSPSVTVALGNGIGGVTTATPYAAGTWPSSVAIADVNGDTRKDLVIGNGVSGGNFAVSFLRNAGAGSFLAPVTTTAGSGLFGGAEVAAGDLDGDGLLDVAVVNPSSSTAKLLFGDGTGSFPTISSYTIGSSAFAVTIASINTDMAPDFAVANTGSNTLSVYLNLAPPGAPTGVAATPGVGKITLSWTPVFGSITGYRIYRGLTSGSETFLIQVGGFAYQDAGLGNGATRYYKISAVNAAGEGPLSSEVSATTFDVPGAPLALNAASGARGEIALQWSPPMANGGTPVTSYRVYSGTTSGGEGYLTTVTGTDFADTGLPDGATRFYTVTAVNAAGEGIPSSEAKGVTIDIPGPPQALSAAPGVSVGEIVVSWQPPASDGGAPVTSYRVCRGTTSGSENTCTTLTGTSYSDTGNLPLTTFYYWVRATNIVGEGPASIEACSKPFPWVAALGC